MNEREIITERIHFLLPVLPKQERRAALGIVSYLQRKENLKLEIISVKTGVSKATITRLCKRVGYKGFRELRSAIGFGNLKEIIKEQTKEVSPGEIMKGVIQENTELMRKTCALVDDSYYYAVQAIIRAGIVLFFGNGDAILPCRLICMKLMKLGITCYAVNDQDIQLFCATATNDFTVVIAVSHTGRSASVVEAVKKAKESGAVTIGVTGAARAPLTKYCSVVLHTGIIEDNRGGDMIARRIGEQIVLETVYVSVLEKMDHIVRAKKMEGEENINRIYKLTESEKE